MQYHPDTQRHSGSATDLANHARCSHLTQLTRAREVAIHEGREQRPDVEDSLVIRKGREFEATTVAARRAEVHARGGRFVDLSELPRAERSDARDAAMRDGVELIAQAPLRAGTIFGYADLLQRVDDAAAPGGTLATVHRYEPVEIKFARTVQPAHLLQASAYADALATLQGELPARMHVITGDGRAHEHASGEYVDYVRVARERFDAALQLDLEAQLDVVPEPVEHCAGCEFKARCTERWTKVDHLSLVARIRADQRTKLVSHGIETLTQLAHADVDVVTGIGRGSLAQLRTQARLQLEARDRDLPGIEFRVPTPGDLSRRGFALLPEPDPQDMFFDFEGYPFHEEGGLEYLWGWTFLRDDGTPDFDHLWADDVEAETEAFLRFLGEVERRRAASPGMHVFHYAPYEITALSRIARRRPEWMLRLDELLRANVFVDLYAVVRQAMLVGTPSYSIKQLEPLYGVDRAGDDLADGGESIKVYEDYLLTHDADERAKIVAYNKVDCDSTLALRDWLLARRDEALAQGIEWPAPAEPDEDADDDPGAPSDPHADEVLRARLEMIADNESRDEGLRTAARLLSAMPGWGWRIKREFLGDLHGRKHDRDVDDYVREPSAIGDLRFVEDVTPDRIRRNGTVVRRYAFPDQMTLLRVGDYPIAAYDPEVALPVGTIVDIDVDALTLDVKTTKSQQSYLDDMLARTGETPGQLPTSIVGWNDIPHRMLEDVARRVAGQLLTALDAKRDPFAPSEPCAAALSILARHAPRVREGDGPESITTPPDPLEVADVVARLDGSHLVVQGPPGTGKTYTAARLLVALVERGMRVGISSNSHEAIRNVLEGLDEYRAERAGAGSPVTATAAYAAKSPLGFGNDWIHTGTGGGTTLALFEQHECDILAGTAWQFRDPDLRLDAVLVDEAGQLSLLNGTAIAACTSRVVLVGDPQQLPQPTSVAHPHGCDASMLEHVFEGAPVLPPDRATLLSVTRRMHPRISEFISDTYYAGLLTAHAETSAQQVVAPAAPEVPSAGTMLHAVEHHGNRSTSPEEVAAIADLVTRLLQGGRVVPKPGDAERDLVTSDIIVVAPYNAQRRLLAEALPEGVRIGTVDKFQGREAPVAIVSMTASSREELPRGLEFLLDPHRLNVAISRARALSIVVASPALLATSAASLREMRLLNDLVRFARVSA